MMVVGVWRVCALRERVVDRCGRFENFGYRYVRGYELSHVVLFVLRTAWWIYES